MKNPITKFWIMLTFSFLLLEVLDFVNNIIFFGDPLNIQQKTVFLVVMSAYSVVYALSKVDRQ